MSVPHNGALGLEAGLVLHSSFLAEWAGRQQVMSQELGFLPLPLGDPDTVLGSWL